MPRGPPRPRRHVPGRNQGQKRDVQIRLVTYVAPRSLRRRPAAQLDPLRGYRNVVFEAEPVSQGREQSHRSRLLAGAGRQGW